MNYYINFKIWKDIASKRNRKKVCGIEYIKTHNKTREFSPEKVKEDIWWILLFSRILQQKKDMGLS